MVRRKAWVFGVIAPALMASSCENITTRGVPATLQVEIYVESSFIAAGDTVVGDTVQFMVRVFDGQEEIPAGDLEFTANPPGGAVEILDASTGEATFTDVGQSTVAVTVGEPDVGTAMSLGASMTVVVAERFYGTIEATSGDFGDTVWVAASALHTFTDTTTIFFPNGTVFFVDSVNPSKDTLWAIVGAGTNTGRLTLRGLKANGTSDRDSVPTLFTFTGGGSVDDPFEPNDDFPLDSLVHRIDVLPFEALLSIDPSKTAPPDTNFFYMRVTAAGGITIDVRSVTQQDSNIDFFICNALGGGINDPPTGHDDPPGCARERGLNDSGADIRVEEEIGVTLGLGRHVFAFYCSGSGPCPTVPTTYKVTIRQP